MSSKRLELQGIRGIAILAVLTFHFYPKIIPNGYLGVDQFFVLSGFLMCMLLTRSENMSFFEFFVNFYTRRFKRILPLYQLFVLLSLLFLFSLFPASSISQNVSSAKKALMFISNRLKTDQENYFEMLSVGMDIFTHTWSLSVEIQFYFLAPFIFLIPYKLVTFSIICLISFAYFCFLPTSLAFLDVFARVWQFMIGMLAFVLSEKYKETTVEEVVEEDGEEKPSGYSKNIIARRTITLFLIAIMFYYKVLPEILIRPLITISTGVLLIISIDDDILLSNNILTYFGDVSYSLYLLHWPIYAYWKLSEDQNKEQCLLFSILFSILIHHVFEKWYIKQSTQNIALITVLILLYNCALLNKQTTITEKTNEIPVKIDTQTSVVWKNKTLEEAKRQNTEWSMRDYQNLHATTCNYEKEGPMGWCNHTGLNPLNKYRIMIVGNSWVANHAKIVYEECGGKAKVLYQGSMSMCEPLYKTTFFEHLDCEPWVHETEKHVIDFQPDYVFHITRHVSYGDEPEVDDFNKDPIYQALLKQLRIYTKNTKKKVFLLDALPLVDVNKVGRIVDFMKEGHSLDEIDRKITSFHNYKLARKRYAQLFKDCGDKCEQIDYVPTFYRNQTDTFRFFADNGLAYLTVIHHFTSLGLEQIRGVWRDVCAKL